MDLEDNETAMNSFDTQVEELKGTIESLEAQLTQNQTQMSDMEAKLEESKAQVKPLSPKSVMPVTPENFHQSNLFSGLCLRNSAGGSSVSELIVGVTVCHG